MRIQHGFALFLALLLLLAVPSLAEEAPNLLQNADFERLDSNGLPDAWQSSAYREQEGYTLFAVSPNAHGGESCAEITNFGMNDARFSQTVSVEPNTNYCLSGYIWAKEIGDTGWGANLSIEGIYMETDSYFDTDGQWVHTELYGRTGPEQTTLTVFVRLGGYSGESEGSARFDDISLRRVDELPPDVYPARWYVNDTAAENDWLGTEEEEAAAASPFWPWLLLISVLYVLLVWWMAAYLLVDERELKQEKHRMPVFCAVGLGLAFVVRYVIAVLVDGYQVDVNCFLSWSGTMASVGPGNFYQATSFCDYPPGYALVLGATEQLARVLSRLFGGELPHFLRRTVLLKLAPMACDLGMAGLAYAVAEKRNMSRRQAGMLCLLVAFNPVLIINSAAWCQVDSVLTLLLLGVVILALEHRWIAALPLYMLAVLMKPQALMVGPLGVLALVCDLYRARKTPEGRLLLQKAAWGLVGAFWVAVAIVLPFMFSGDGIHWNNSEGRFWLTALYGNALSSYPYATVNTANLYYVFGGNWSAISVTAHGGAAMVLCAISVLWGAGCIWQNKRYKQKLWYAEGALMAAFAIAFLLMACMRATWGTVGFTAMAFAFAVVIPLFLRAGRMDVLPLLGGVLFVLLYVLGVKMHERYLFPALVLLALAFALHRDWRILVLLALTSATMTMNVGIVLDNAIRLGASMGHLNNDTSVLNWTLSLLNLLAVPLALWVSSDVCLRGDAKLTPRPRPLLAGAKHHDHAPRGVLTFVPDSKLHWKRLDTVLMLSVTLVYSVVALWNLGSTKAPQTTWVSSSAEEEVVLDLGKHYEDMTMLYFCQVSYSDFSIAVSDDGQTWSSEYWARMNEGECYRWLYLMPSVLGADGSRTYMSGNKLENVQRLSGHYVRVSSQQIGLRLNEVLFRDRDGQAIHATVVRHTGANANSPLLSDPANLVDEPDSLQGEPGWYTGTYFDEIYHARTAKEYLDGTSPYEWTHPPLGKVIMSWFIAIFGMTPFGWRFGGAFVGILMLPAMYLLGKQITKRTDMAFAAMSMMALDCMHLTQTRIATIDSYPVLFIILSYLFMARFMQRDITLAPMKKLLPDLALSGLFMGLGIASKWIVAYAAVGLAILYFWTCARHIRLSRQAAKLIADGGVPEERQDELQKRARHGLLRLLYLCLWCVLFFIIVPVVIYFVSYIPHFAHAQPESLRDFVTMVIELQYSTDSRKLPYTMFGYHSTPGLGMDHAFYSPWYEWPLMKRPMYYAMASYMPEGYSQAIFCFGNPAVWLVGLVGIAFTLCAWAKHHAYTIEGRRGVLHLSSESWDIAPAFVLIGLLAEFLPWVLVPRGTYIYHYFASIPFLILGTMLALHWLSARFPKVGRGVLIGYLVACLICFIGFYPYASGMPAPYAWLDLMMRFLNIYYSM